MGKADPARCSAGTGAEAENRDAIRVHSSAGEKEPLVVGVLHFRWFILQIFIAYYLIGFYC